MKFLIAESFTDSLARLSGDEQKAAKTTAFDLQLNPANPGLQLHRIQGARDKSFWSVRVNRDIRIIVHRTESSLLLCYVDHHDEAYRWAEQRRLERHPRTGAAQLVEVVEKVREIEVPQFVAAEPAPPPAGPPLFAAIPEADLLIYGVPTEWVSVVQEVTEDTLFDVADHLPQEAAEALLELATGGRPRVERPSEPDSSPFDHPDAQRRFRVMDNVEELERALDYPWEKWTVFLHPEQRQVVERDYSGPARVSGSAGTGKTIVALHRAVYLAREHRDARVVLATFSDLLARSLRTKLRRLIGNEPRIAERIEVRSVTDLGLRLYKAQFGKLRLARGEDVRELLSEASAAVHDDTFSLRFLLAEWEHVVDAWQLETWEEYRDVARLGRKTRLPESRREILWTIFEKVRQGLEERGLLTESGMFSELASVLGERKHPPFDFAVVDEAQDISVSQLKLFSALGGDRPNALFFTGDLGQRIFRQPFSWKSLGVEILGRSFTLRVNYRTSHQIRQQADRLLDPQVVDADGNIEDRSDTVSVFNGPLPKILVVTNEEDEAKAVAEWLGDRSKAGVLAHEIGVFVRSGRQLERAKTAVEQAGLTFSVLDDSLQPTSEQVAISTMHLAKGLEFRAVAVMACDDEVIPLQERIETVGDEADLQEVYETERHLLYVACTRARDYLLITAVAPASEFLDDLRS